MKLQGLIDVAHDLFVQAAKLFDESGLVNGSRLVNHGFRGAQSTGSTIIKSMPYLAS
jgi:hypothetical protein